MIKMVKKRKVQKSKSKKMKKFYDMSNTLSFLRSGGGMFKGMKIGLGVGDKAFVLGKGVNMKGHEPQAKFAALSDGSKITLIGKNKGLIVR